MRKKIAYAWNHLDYAAPDYVEIAVLELLLVETQYSLLIRRYRLLLGIQKESTLCAIPATKTSSIYLEGQLQNHVFYGALLNPSAEIHSSKAQQLVSHNQ